jgi:LacI family transcriptional regulator
MRATNGVLCSAATSSSFRSISVPVSEASSRVYSVRTGSAARLLSTGEPFTALFATNDLMAAGAIRALAERGISVPAEMSVIGFDDAPLAEMISPALTTMRQPLQDMAHAAVSLLLARITDANGGPPTRRILPTSLVVRESTARKP